MFLKRWFEEAFDFQNAWPYYFNASTGIFLKFLFRSVIIICLVAIVELLICWQVFQHIVDIGRQTSSTSSKPTVVTFTPTVHITVKVTPKPKPTIQPTKPPVTIFTFGNWNSKSWLNSSEVLSLTTQQNVINLAACEDGKCHYSRLYSTVVNQNWTLANGNTDVNNIANIASSPTGFTFKDVYSNSYTLNMYQPFIVKSQPRKIFMVDSSGNLWWQWYSDRVLVPLGKAKASVTSIITIAPNSGLTPTQ